VTPRTMVLHMVNAYVIQRVREHEITDCLEFAERSTH